eukprot:6212938-Pleurochrysis_carterae.AAC.18
MANQVEEDLMLFTADGNARNYRNYVFTKNHYMDEDIDRLDAAEVKHMIYGKEIAPTTGTPHLQGLNS